MLKNGKTKLFHRYYVFLPTKWSEKKEENFGLNPALFNMRKRSWQLSDRKNWAMLKTKILVCRFLPTLNESGKLRNCLYL